MTFQQQNSFNATDKVEAPLPKRSKRIFLSGLLLVILAGVGFMGWKAIKEGKLSIPFVPSPLGTTAQFSLDVSDIDTAGIATGARFILKSSHDLNEKDIENIVKFNPKVEFEVKDVTKKFSIIPVAMAQIETLDSGNGKKVESVFELTPTEPLKEDEIYQVIISNLDYADREYFWAFQVKAEFQIIKTHPGKQSTRVPINSGIEITFNRENLSNPESYFKISPDVAGTFDSYGNTLVFMPKELAPETIYTVTIKNGLKTVGSDDALKGDYSFAFETTYKAYNSRAPRFSFDSEFAEFTSQKKPVVMVSSYNIASSDNILSAELYELPNVDEFLSSYQSSRNFEFMWGYYYRSSGVRFDKEKASKVLSFTPEVFKSGYRQYIELPSLLDNGYYVLDVYNSTTKKHQYLWMQVSPLSYYYSITHDKSIMWLYDFLSKTPFNGADVFSIEGIQKSTQLLAKTDDKGLAKFATPVAMQTDDDNVHIPNFFKIAKQGYLPLLVKVGAYSNYGFGKAAQGDLYWDFLSTERPAYQISDTVKYWGVIKGRSQDMRQKKVTVGLYEGYYYPSYGGDSMQNKQAFVKKDVMVSSFDTIQGELSFQGLSPGFYVLITSSGDEVFSSVSFRVLSFVKPAYQISVEASKQSIFAGEAVNFKVNAKFFDGTPVSKLKLKYSSYWNRSSIKGTLVLDENGEGVFSYTPSYYESTSNYWPNNLNIYFSPVLAEEGEISAQANTMVFGPNVYLQVEQEHKGSDTYQLTAKLNEIVLQELTGDKSSSWREEYIGESVAGMSVSANLIERTYTKVEIGQYYDPIDKIVKKNYRYDSHEETIKQFNGVTDSNGEWSFVENIPKKEGASYRFEFFGKDKKQRKFDASVYPRRDNPITSISLKLNEENYQKDFSVGENINLELQVPEDIKVSGDTLFYRYQNNIDSTWMRAGFTLQEEFKDSFSPSVAYQAVVLTSSGFKESNKVTASIKDEDKKLTVDITPEKAKYKPGEEIKVDFLVRDKDERPVSAEVNVAVVDEALFHVLPYSWETNILQALYKNINVTPIRGLTQYYDKNAEMAEMSGDGAEMGGCFLAGTTVLMADGKTKPIEKIRMGDEIFTFGSDNDTTLKQAVVQGISAHFVDEYLIINGSLKVTPEHQVYLNNEWQISSNIEIGDFLKDSQGKPKEVFSKDYVKAGQVPVYNIIVGKYHTYIADDYFVHNEEKGGSPRMDFVDVALYRSFQTKKNGKGSFSFTAPDNITSWRTTALAFSSDEMKAGQNSELIPVSLPLFVDTTLSDYYLVGDAPQIRLRVFGDELQQNQETEFSLTSKSLGIDLKQSFSANTGHFSLGALKEGEHEMIAAATQGNLMDSLLRKIQVVKSYFRVGQNSVYDLSESLSDIESNKNGFTRLLFIAQGKAKFYRTISGYSYYSGIRIDQTASKYFAIELLREYFDSNKNKEPIDLSGYHADDGGIGLFAYSDSDLELSAKVADLAQEFLIQDNLVNYFNASLTDKKTDIHRVAKALYGLAALQKPVLTKLNLVKTNKSLNLEDKVYIALAFAKLGDIETSYNIYETDIRPQLRFQGDEAWLYNEDITEKVKLTSTIGVLVSYLNIKEDSDALWQYMSTHNPEKDLDALEELIFIRNELLRLPDQKAEFSFRTNERKEKVNIESGRVYSITLSEKELETIRFSDIEGEISLISFYERSRDPSELTLNSELSLTRQYLVDGIARNVFSDGEVVLVRLDPNIAPTAIDGQYQIIDYLPSGLRPVTQTYKQGLKRGDECDPVWYPSKVIGNVVYFNIYKGFNKTKYCTNRTINYYARVVSRGIYSANPAVIQSAKDLESLNLSQKSFIEIK